MLDGPGRSPDRPEFDEHTVMAAYARWAPVYDALFGTFTRSGRRAALAAANTLPPARILEAGVGTGLALPGYRRDHRIVGIDLSQDMLQRARRRAERHGLTNVEALRCMDAAELTMPEASFDVVMAMFVMSVVPDPEAVLAGFVRVMRPGGRLVMVNHFAAEAGTPAASIETALARFAPGLGWKPDFQLARVLNYPGLSLIARRPVGPAGLFTMLQFARG